MARDGLIPRFFGKVSAETRTPVVGTLVTGSVVAVTAALIPLGQLAEATSIGTLFAFALVGVSVMYLRRTQPDARAPSGCLCTRWFRCWALRPAST